MLIKNPENQVLAFHMLEWVVENESAPKKEVKNFLRSQYEAISGNKVKAVAEEGEKDEVEEGDDSDLREWLLDTAYSYFSLTEDGKILLSPESADEDNLLLTDVEARDLLPKLKAKLEDRVAKLSKLLK